MAMVKTLDVRSLPPRERHPLIFGEWQSLPVGRTLRLVNDHDPKPLYYEFNAEHNGEFAWDYIERGPEKWMVDIKRIAAQSASGAIRSDQTVKEVLELHPATREVFVRHGLDLCCGGVHPIAMAAEAHGLDAGKLLTELNEAAAPPLKPACAGISASAKRIPIRETSSASDGKVLTLDVRDLEPPEPMTRILSLLPDLGPNDRLEVTHFREPKPLYPKLEEAGFVHEIEKLGEALYRFTIRRRP